MLRTFPNTLRPRWIERRRWGLSIPDLISMYNAILDHHWRQGLNISHMSECLDNTSKLFWMFPSWHYSCCYNCFQTSIRACRTLRRKRPWALASDTQLADRYSGSRLNWLMSDAMYTLKTSSICTNVVQGRISLCHIKCYEVLCTISWQFSIIAV